MYKPVYLTSCTLKSASKQKTDDIDIVPDLLSTEVWTADIHSETL